MKVNARDTRQPDFSRGIEELTLPLIHIGAPTQGYSSLASPMSK